MALVRPVQILSDTKNNSGMFVNDNWSGYANYQLELPESLQNNNGQKSDIPNVLDGLNINLTQVRGEGDCGFLNFNAIGEGNVQVFNSKGELLSAGEFIPSGEMITFRAIADENEIFIGWNIVSGNPTIESDLSFPELTFPFDTNVKIVAQFGKPTATSVVGFNGGSIPSDMMNLRAMPGELVSLTPTSDANTLYEGCQLDYNAGVNLLKKNDGTFIYTNANAVPYSYPPEVAEYSSDPEAPNVGSKILTVTRNSQSVSSPMQRPGWSSNSANSSTENTFYLSAGKYTFSYWVKADVDFTAASVYTNANTFNQQSDFSSTSIGKTAIPGDGKWHRIDEDFVITNPGKYIKSVSVQADGGAYNWPTGKGYALSQMMVTKKAARPLSYEPINRVTVNSNYGECSFNMPKADLMVRHRFQRLNLTVNHGVGGTIKVNSIVQGQNRSNFNSALVSGIFDPNGTQARKTIQYGGTNTTFYTDRLATSWRLSFNAKPIEDTTQLMRTGLDYRNTLGAGGGNGTRPVLTSTTWTDGWLKYTGVDSWSSGGYFNFYFDQSFNATLNKAPDYYVTDVVMEQLNATSDFPTSGVEQTVTAIPNAGYEFVRWNQTFDQYTKDSVIEPIDGTSLESTTLKFIMPQDHVRLTPVFRVIG